MCQVVVQVLLKTDSVYHNHLMTRGGARYSKLLPHTLTHTCAGGARYSKLNTELLRQWMIINFEYRAPNFNGIQNYDHPDFGGPTHAGDQ